MSESTDVGEQRILAGRYAIGEFIGQGGMSTVYRGTDTKLGRQVAIKVMKANLAGDEQFRLRFRQEAQSASRLAHPSVVRVLDAGDDLIQTADGPQRLPFIVMEFVDGQNLRQLLGQGPLSHAEACRVVDAVLTALEYSHRAGIVHRDIKPANIMITRSGQVKVMDFGIARAVSETSSTVQQTTAILGTAAYFSPEQAKGETVDARTDLYSVGVLLYELLAGDVPFRGDTAVAVAYQHVSERPQPPTERNPSIPPELERIVLHALAKDRARRFQSASEFREALALALSGTMPKLGGSDDQTNVLFSGGDEVSESELALRQLSEGGGTRTQSRPPVMWTWAAILTVGAVIIAVVFWLMTLAPKDIQPSNTRQVPELVNVEKDTALKTLKDMGIVAVPVEQSDDKVAAGHVISTDPAGGSKIDLDTSVRVVISTGPVSPDVPDFQNLSVAEYTKKLEGLGLSIGVIKKQDDAVAPADRVLAVSPAVGTGLKPGDSVQITIASGSVNVPDVKGQSLDAAKSLLSGLGLDVTVTPRNTCPQTANLPIVEQSAAGQQPQGTKLEIFYCAG